MVEGVSCLFNIIAASKDTINDYVLDSVHKLLQKNDPDRLTNKFISLEISEFNQLIQEDRYVSAYVDSILSFCKSHQVL